MYKKPENFEQVVLFLAQRLKDFQYAFRGTTGLVLQGLEMNVDDIDLLCDKNTALKCNELLNEFLEERVIFSESDKFKSYFGKFSVKGIPVEVMGEWQIKDTKDNWSNPFDASTRVKVKLNNFDIYVTPVNEELTVFAKMGRWTAYQQIKKQIKKPGSKEEIQPAFF